MVKYNEMNLKQLKRFS